MKYFVLFLIIGFTFSCTSVPTLLDTQENTFGISENTLGANHRVFHNVLHYPHGTGLRIPGYIVGIEKASQDNVAGPRNMEGLVAARTENLERTDHYWRLMNEPKTHLITHVMKYQPANEGSAIFEGRIRPCALYSLVRAGGEIAAVADAPWHDDRMAQQLFPGCDENGQPGDARYPFAQSWDGITALRESLVADMRTEYTHILVVVMGWNTPQDNAIQNYNSVLAHLLDEVESRRHYGSASPEEWAFKPLVVGVTWSSDWELGDTLPLPDALVRLSSFPNKANDADEVGLTWLNAVISNAVLAAREEANSDAKVVLIGHSFGARASLTAVTQHGELARPAAQPSANFAPGDLFIALQGAFKIDAVFADSDVDNGISEKFDPDGLRLVLSASLHDSANELAIWGLYAGSVDAYQAICAGIGSPGVSCQYIENRPRGVLDGYGYSLCISNPPERLSRETNEERLEITDWKDQTENAMLYVDVTPLTTCRAAFTGGGSHSDIYRRETARFLWDLIR